MSRVPTGVTGGLWWLAIALAYLLYAQGFSGAFVFDDFPNLSALSALGAVDSWESVRYYLASGFSGPTGRPVALLSFLIDANAWPTDAGPFKRTNTLIHLLNATLVFWILIRLLRLVWNKGENGRAEWLAFFVAAAWLFHPYLVSTTLYVVQRMAQLAALFCFAGMLVYLFGRVRAQSRPVSGYLMMTMGLGVATLLAVLSKENGALLPLLVLIMELTVLTRARLQPLHRAWMLLVLVLPSVLIALYLLRIPFNIGWTTDYATRDFSPLERLLTQARVVLSYLYDWFVPKMFTVGVFHDDIVVSESLLAPRTTLPAVLTVLGMIAGAIVFRKKHPFMAFAVLFFLGSQLIESTTVALELKFEHRAYLGSAFLLLPALMLLFERMSAPRAMSGGFVLLTLLVLLSAQATALWGDYPKMVMIWAAKSPDSARAQREAARWHYIDGRPVESLNTIERAAARMPDDFGLRVTQIIMQCRLVEAQEKDKEAVVKLARRGYYAATEFNLFTAFYEWSASEHCNGLDVAYFHGVIEALLDSPRNQRVSSLQYAQLHYLRGRALLALGEEEEAREAFERSLASRRDPHKLMNIAVQFAVVGNMSDAYHYASIAQELVASGRLRGREAASAPLLTDIDAFVDLVAPSATIKEESFMQRELDH